jgi:hypothetical protein
MAARNKNMYFNSNLSVRRFENYVHCSWSESGPGLGGTS